MRSRNPLCRRAAALLLAAAFSWAPASAEPGWAKTKTSSANLWCTVHFNDEFGDKQVLLCRANECCADRIEFDAIDKGGIPEIPLYSSKPATGKDCEAGITCYEAADSAYSASYSAKGWLNVTRPGVRSGMTGTFRSPGAFGSEKYLTVIWTPKGDNPPESPLADASKDGTTCNERFWTPYGRNKDADDRGWIRTRFLLMEIELAGNIGALESAGIKDLLGCPEADCGYPGDLHQFREGIHNPVRDYAAHLRKKIVAEAKKRRDEADKPADKAKLTEFEANLVNCLLSEASPAGTSPDAVAQFRTKVKEAVKGKESLEKFVGLWRRLVKSELEVYGLKAAKVDDEVTDQADQLKAITSRVLKLLADKDLSKDYEAEGLKPVEAPVAAAKPKIDDKVKSKVKKATKGLDDGKVTMDDLLK